jgi:hypothetical protein
MKVDRRYGKLAGLALLVTAFTLSAAYGCQWFSMTIREPVLHLFVGCLVVLVTALALCWLLGRAIDMFNVDVLYEKRRPIRGRRQLRRP